jgi:hypothetical protein
MSKVEWRPYVNALTKPRSYLARVMPKETIDYADLARILSEKNPLWSADLVESILRARDEEVLNQLVIGNQVSLENAFTYHLSLAVRLDSVDDPLPADKSFVKVQVFAARDAVERVQQQVEFERLPPTEKAPVIAGAEDTVWNLDNVLNPQGLLRLTGTDLLFDPHKQGEQCLISGTRSGSTIQSRFGPVSNTEVMVMPDVPPQDDPWNNEYRVSITTHYTEHGSPRTGAFSLPLRTPLTLSQFSHPNPPEHGILTGSAAAPNVVVTGGSLSADSTVRVEVMQDLQQEELVFRLLDMQEDGAAGAELAVTHNGDFTLSGFAGSALTSLDLTVNDYTGLWEMIRTDYGGRLVDILQITTA